MEDARFTEETRTKDAPLIEQIGHGVCVFGQTGREQDALVEFTHLAQEFVHVGPLQHVDLVHRSVNLYRYDEVCVADRLNVTSR